MKIINNCKLTNSTFYKEFKFILWVALLLRLIAVIFSQGYGMHDDHFLVIEAAGSWVEGFDYNRWLPWTAGNHGPEGHSFTYVGLNYLFFYLLKLVGIVDPKIMMFLERLVHALFSMLVVVYGAKITLQLSNLKTAKIVAWLLAALWIMPFISVRQLFEVTPIPFIMLGLYLLLNADGKQRNYIIAGLLFGLATSFRYQIGVFAIGIAAVYFFQWKWNVFFQFCAGVLIMFCITQGVVDYFIWGYPFAEMWGYVTYNMNEGTQYLPNSNYFMYFLVLMGSLLFPLGIMAFIGFFKTKKEYLLLFIPTLLFLLFHTFYPNRQERFILTVLPVFIVLGMMGINQFKKCNFDSKMWRISWISFWVLNIPLLIFASTMYSKKSRVEAMYSIYEQNTTPKNLLMEGSGSHQTSLLPRFYSKDWAGAYHIRTSNNQPLTVTENAQIDYIFFFDDVKLQNRIKFYQKIYPKMSLHKKCYPSFVDIVLREVNPKNKNEYIEVWKTNTH